MSMESNRTASQSVQGKRTLNQVKDISEIEEHKVPLRDLLQSLEVKNEDYGLSEEKANIRLEQEGRNTIARKKKHWTTALLQSFTNWFALMLNIATAVSFYLYDQNPTISATLYIAVGVLVVYAGVGFSLFYLEMKSKSSQPDLNNYIPPMCRVLREGHQMTIQTTNLVRGDIAVLMSGDRVPADIRIFKATDMKVDNSCLTGDGEAKTKSAECTQPDNPYETQNLAFQGTIVVSGVGRGVVLFTGNHTVLARLDSLAATETSNISTLQWKIYCFAVFVAGVALALDLLIWTR